MARGPVAHFLQQLQRLTRRSADGDGSDADLLRRFCDHGEEIAFECLVQRHGPLVLDVCRRALGNDHEAEDAFQATFLVLVRRAGSIRRREALASWLYGVALRTARKARSGRRPPPPQGRRRVRRPAAPCPHLASECRRAS